MSDLYRYSPDFQNELHECAFEGYLDKLHLLLSEYCVYQRNLHNETALFHAISNRQIDVIQELWKIYTNDIKFVRDQIGSGAELNHPIFIAFGAKTIVEIEHFYQQYIEHNDTDKPFCDILVLMKLDNFTPTKVLKLSVSSESITTAVKMVATCFEHGVLDLNAHNNLEDSLLDIAVCNGLLDTVLQLMDYGASVDMHRIQWNAIKYGQQSIICKLEGKCEIVPIDIKQSENIDELIGNGNWDGLMYVMIHTGVTIDDLISSSGLSLFHTAIINFQEDLAEKCWNLKPNYKTVNLNGTLPVHDAISRNLKNLVNRMLHEDSELILLQDQSGKNCLHLMAAKNWMNELRDIFQKNPLMKLEFFKNAQIGLEVLQSLIFRYDIAQFIIRETINIVPEDTFYEIFKMVAGSPLTDILKYLLEVKEIDLRNSNESPIIVAFKESRISNVEILLDHARDYLNEIFDEHHNNLLKYAIYSRPTIGQRCRCRNTADPYNLAGISDRFESVDEEYPPYVELNSILEDLLAKGVNYNNINNDGMNLLHIAADGANLFAIRKFLSLNVDENHKDNFGFLPMWYCKNIPSIELFTSTTYENIPTYLFARRPKLLEYVLEKGADVAVENKEKQTALHFVGRLDACETLLNHNANVNHLDENGCTPIHVMFSQRAYRIGIHMLTTEGVDLTILDKYGDSYLKYFLIVSEYPSLYESAQFTDLVRDHCNDFDDLCVPYFHSAIENNETLTKIFLAQQNIDFNVRNGKTGDTSLHCAAYFNKTDVIKELLVRGLNVNVRNTENQTPLHLAIRQGNWETVDILLEHNGNVDLADNDGLTALHDAAQYDKSGLRFCGLLQKSLNPRVRDLHGKSPGNFVPELLRRMFYFV